MTYTPCTFERDDYLQYADVFENLTLDDVEAELCEHNHDISDIAYELAYSRYRIAKLEALSSALQAKIDQLMFEYCPDEMTSDQIAEFAKNQEPLGEEFERVLNENLWELYDNTIPDHKAE